MAGGLLRPWEYTASKPFPSEFELEVAPRMVARRGKKA